MKKIVELIKSNKALILADQFIFSGGNFITSLLLARLLGPSTFGIYAALVLGIYLAISVSNAIIIQPFQVQYAKEKHKSSYLVFTLLLQLLFATLLFLFVYLFSSKINYIQQQFQGILIPSLIYVVGYLMHDFFRKLYLVLNDFKKVLLIDSSIIAQQMIAVAVLFFTKNKSLTQCISNLSFSYLILILFIAFTLIFYSFKLKYIKSYFILHLKQGKWLLSTSVIQWLSSNMLVMAAGIFLGSSVLGAFRLVQSIFGLINIVLQTVENYIIPNASKLYCQNQDLLFQYLRSLSKKGAILFGTLLLSLAVFAKPLIIIAAGKQYEPYSYIIQQMCLLYVFIFLSYPFRILLRVKILNKEFFIGYLLSFVFTLITHRYFLQHWQVSGAIAGLIFNQIILLIVWYFLYQKKYEWQWK